jgi:hypothetical protein
MAGKLSRHTLVPNANFPFSMTYFTCFFVFRCTCCTVAQMARHTGEYEAYPHVFFSTSGHPPGTPLTV